MSSGGTPRTRRIVVLAALAAVAVGGYGVATWGRTEPMGACLLALQCRSFGGMEPPRCETLDERDVCLIPCGRNVHVSARRGLGDPGAECPPGLVCRALAAELRGPRFHVAYDSDYCVPEPRR